MDKIPESAPNPLLKLDNQLCFSVYALSRLITKTYQPLLEQLDVTYPQYLVLLVLWEHNTLSVKQLGEKLLLDSGTLTPLLKRMEQRQWLSRQRDPRDERSVVVTLTDAGRGLERNAQQIPEQVAERLQMAPPELAVLRTQLQQLVTLLT
ncbi:MarR family winged helix-turn-helix transcriptional regulator [Hymenobacter arizonensis]|uniref:DNA-binding transcriptional regulator, MarR family n=1 Tax=Hymenobacter arizonensis TaxID=1227077 RepID=A0A1I5UT49_HYMAR|nr:MarR family transcriptional regulator [Hymenobacter arizonensis]SFP98370.1 DNA-binding transcriptional regulator, MarR family [Hymenobacter arizonensis]